MDSFVVRVQRIQKELQALSKELDDILQEHSPIQHQEQSHQQVILPARKRGRPKKEDIAAREAAKEIQKAEDAAKSLVAEIKPVKKLKVKQNSEH